MTFLHSRILRKAVRPLSGALMGALVSLALLPSASAQAVRRLSAVPAASAARVALPNSVSERTTTAQVVGHLPGETKMVGMKLYLKPTAAQSAALTQLLADQQDPGSSSYHKWLTPQQYGAQFGVGDEDLAVLQNWLQARGFSVDEVAPSRNFITFSGTASTVENAFGTTLQQYRRNNRDYFENASNITIPAALADVVGGVTGLSSYRVPAPQSKHAKPQKTASPDYYSGTPGTNYLVPGDIQIIFDMTPLLTNSFNGTGITIGVIGQSAVDTTQLTNFQNNTDQTPVKLPTLTLVPNTGASNKVAGDEGESELDLEYSSGVAQGATINFIYTGCTNTASTNVLPSTTNCNNNGVFDALTYGVTHSLATIFSLSYGECEPAANSSDIKTLEPVLQQANAQGETVVVASGDNGSATCDQGSGSDVATQGLSVSYPASSQYVTAVGGTQLAAASSNWNNVNTANGSSALGYIAETSWNDTAANNTPDPGAGNESPAASGGGVSKVFTKPTWQAGTGVPADGYRDVPDIALPASDYVNGYLVCNADSPCTAGSGFSGGYVYGGTSVSTPDVAGMLAIIEQANGNTAGLGNINPRLYTLAQSSSYSSIFHDITTGNNFVNCQPGSTGCTSGATGVQSTGCPLTASTLCYGYSAGVGYDQVTGLGSLDANELRVALSTVSSNTPALALTLSSNTPAPAAPVTFTLSVTGTIGTATGSVQFAVDGSNVGSAVSLSSGVATYNYTSGFSSTGSHSVTATYSAGNYNSANATISVNVAQAMPTVVATVTPSTPTQNVVATLTATVSGTQGTPTGTVQFRVGGTNVGSPVTLSVVNGNNVATLNYPFTTTGNQTVSAVYSGNASYVTGTQTIQVSVATSTATQTPTVAVSTTPTAPSTAAAATLTATISGTSGNGTPTGQVTFSVTAPGTTTAVPLTPVNVSNGVATTTYTFPAAGSYTVTAAYSGDAVYIPKTNSAAVTVTAPSFTLAVTPASLTISNGNSGTITLTATSVNGFSGTVTPSQYSVQTLTGVTFGGCLAFTSTTSQSITVPTGGTGSMQLAVITNSANCTTSASRMAPMKRVADNQPLSRWGSTGFGLVSAAGLLGCFFFRRRIRPGLLALLVISALALGISGCGSPGTGSAGSAGGTYTVTVTGTSGNTSANATFNLTVQ